LNSEGLLTVLRDVVVQTTETGTLVVIDAEPRKCGERLTIDSMVDNKVVTIAVEVVSCRPIVRGGDVQHEVVMKPIEVRR
jgi:hypothetical protein